MSDTSVPATWFEELYKRDPDPWRFASSLYERDKYAATLAAIGEERVNRAWEVGCSIGVFTQALAARCTEVLGVDVAEAALDQARQRCAADQRISFARLRVPREWPEGQFDLIVFSEVLYFLSAADVRETARQSVGSLMPHGRIVLVNWTGETGQAMNGETAANIFHEAAAPHVTLLCREWRPGYRLDVYRLKS